MNIIDEEYKSGQFILSSANPFFDKQEVRICSTFCGFAMDLTPAVKKNS